MSDWNPAQYAMFAGLRLQPALDLLARVPALPRGPVIDLGCGNGPVGPVLRRRYPDARIVGLDSSPAMLARAGETGSYDALAQEDIGSWSPDTAPALIFTNAALHWLPDHAALMPRLAALLAEGGTLAVQMPHQNPAPSHRAWLDLADEVAPGRLDPATVPGILDAPAYFDILSGLGALSLWETEYSQLLPASATAHPVREFTSSTFARPVLTLLDEGETVRIQDLYDERMETAYPRRADGTVVFPFRRLFFTVTRDMT